jgi:hypothetical protein
VSDRIRGVLFAVLWAGGFAYVVLQAGGGPSSGEGTLFLYAAAFAPAFAVFVWRAALREVASHEGPLLALALVWAVLDASNAAATLARIAADERRSACYEMQCQLRRALADESAPVDARRTLLEHFDKVRSVPHFCSVRTQLGRSCEASPECRIRIEDGRLACADHGMPRPVRGRGVIPTVPKCDAPEALPASLR